MYIPRPNEETRLPVLHGLIEAEPLAALVTFTSKGLVASHIPMVLDRSTSGFGILRGHVARPNEQWRTFDASVEALAIFAGPQQYITPNWYPEKQEHGKVVPTWNYIVVHAYGPLTAHEEPEWLMPHLEQLVAQNEAAFPSPWKITDAPADYVRSQMKGIVGLELPITRLEGRWKLSQNRSARDKQGVIDGLAELDTPGSRAMKDLVIERS
jgi:transcriptional regulator